MRASWVPGAGSLSDDSWAGSGDLALRELPTELCLLSARTWTSEASLAFEEKGGSPIPPSTHFPFYLRSMGLPSSRPEDNAQRSTMEKTLINKEVCRKHPGFRKGQNDVMLD
ncbi:hypothetical protein R6Z07F_007268 [Ovis aries]